MLSLAREIIGIRARHGAFVFCPFIGALTHAFKVVFPDTTNRHRTMLGGRILMMAGTAFITAIRFSGRDFVMVSGGKIEFAKPIPDSTLVELLGRGDGVGDPRNPDHRLGIYGENGEKIREKLLSGTFAFLANIDGGRPAAIIY